MTDHPVILVFDVNETVLDIEPLAPLFFDWFADSAAMRTWFAELIVYSQTLTLAGGYVDFAMLAVSVLRMVAESRGVRLPEDAADRSDRDRSRVGILESLQCDRRVLVARCSRSHPDRSYSHRIVLCRPGPVARLQAQMVSSAFWCLA